ncbi:unnamed protein product [Linum trigynum]|uniref:R13L1/DRL21-like LRR repeat region domain-containing protein n=1 Tax=Linum trigynum TaxID=586398 RepID=A0AAV2GF76_9ROSI
MKSELLLLVIPIIIPIRPHSNLEKLTIKWYPGRSFPSDFFRSRLEEIKLEFCEKCEYLPPLHRNPALKKLNISFCSDLKGLWKDNTCTTVVGVEDADQPSPCSFPCLSSLTILGPHQMKQIPAFPNLDGSLHWGLASLDTLLRSMDTAGYEGSASLPVSIHQYSLRRLKELELSYVNDFEDLHEE